MSKVVAIDGPAGAGKSTVARMVAERMGYCYINTGSLYRAVAYAAIKRGMPFAQVDDAFLHDLVLEYRHGVLFLNGEKLDSVLRTPECAQGASIVSAMPHVRTFLLSIQRDEALKGWIVMEGRDIGTVVFPDAEKKFFVTASVEERARRRLAQKGEVAAGANYAKVLAEIKERDDRDASRAVAPMKAADDAVTVDTTGFTIDEVVKRIIGYLR